MKVWVIYNPAAGQRDVRSEVREVVDYLRARGWEAKAFETRAAGDATRYARDAVSQNCNLVFSVGGDGTLNEVVNGIVGSNVAVGPLPVGTGNVWAKEIGLPVWGPLHPQRLIDTVKILEDGSIYTIDVGCANGHYFLLWAGVGFDAEIVEGIEPQVEVKRRWGYLAFVAEGINVALGFVGTRAQLQIDQVRLRRRVVLILVNNTQSYTAGLMRVAPDACLDDGYLNVCVFEGEGFFSTIRHVLGMVTQMHLRDPQVYYHRARYLKVETSKPMAVHVDGLPIGHTPLDVTMAPHALKVLLPRRVRKTLFANPNVVSVPLYEAISGNTASPAPALPMPGS